MNKIIKVLFKPFNNIDSKLKKIYVKKVGHCFEYNKDFIIEISINQSYTEKIITLLEELLHFIIRLILSINKKSLDIKIEHKIINKIIELFKEEHII